MNNPVVLISTHQRTEITSNCIDSLMMQSVQPKIVLVVSCRTEARYYASKYPEIRIYGATNHPLGAKWQLGVDKAKDLKPDPLIICGSDDILGIDFIENACAIIKSGIDFIGLSRWHIYHESILYTYDYNASVPLGGGRCYSSKALRMINYKVFDIRRNSGLDDFGWKAVNSTTMPRKIIRDVKNEGLNIVSIKGDWAMLNPFTKFIGHKNVTLVNKSRDISDLNNLINYAQPKKIWGESGDSFGSVDWAHDDLAK